MQGWHLDFSYNINNYFFTSTMCWINCWRYKSEHGISMCHLVGKRNNKQATAGYSGHMMMGIYRVIRVYKAGGSCLLSQWSSGKTTLKEAESQVRFEKPQTKRRYCMLKANEQSEQESGDGRLRQKWYTIIHDP